MPLLSVGLVAGSIARASGNASFPEIILGIAGVINLVLDYVFIFGKFGFPAIGIQGVAIGTGLSWLFIFVVLMIYMIKEQYLVFPHSKAIKSFANDLLTLGIPSIVAQIVAPFTLVFVTYLLGKIDSNAVAAYGVSGRIETLLTAGVMGVCTAMTPFIAQNMGAKKVERIDTAIIYGGKAATYLGIISFILLLLFIPPIARVFTDSELIISYTSLYFYLVGGSYVFYGIYLVTASIFNGLKLPNKSLKVMLVKTIAFTIPLTMIGSYFSIHGVFFGLAVSNILGGLYARLLMRKELKKVNSSLVKRSSKADMLNDIKLLFTKTK
jgi:putative MATE family efflux protein